MTPRNALIALGSVTLAVGIAFAPLVLSGSVGTDGGPTLYALPDGGPWPFAPDASQLVTCVVGPTALTTYCVVATGSGYEEHGGTPLPDGGLLLGLVQSPSCACAGSGGPCLFADGGQVGAGTYPAAQVSGLGCVRRPCVELSGFSGATGGCAP